MAKDLFTVRWERDLRRKVSAEIRGAAVRGVTDAAEELLTVAGDTVPHLLGTLERSGTVSVDEAKIAAAVSYDTPYAVRQHEDTSLNHPDPLHAVDPPISDPRGRAKWLQLALQENAPRLRNKIAAAIRDTTNRGG